MANDAHGQAGTGRTHTIFGQKVNANAMEPVMTAQEIGELSIKLAEAAFMARAKGDDVDALFFALKAAECLQLAKLRGWEGVGPPVEPRPCA